MKWKTWAYLVVMLAFFITAIFGWVWTDNAETKFWWTFWVVAAIISLIGFIAGIYWLGKSNRKL